jgi:hypothetical protein
MALIRCKGCQSEISPEAQACPSCGRSPQLKVQKAGCGVFALIPAVLLAIGLLAGLVSNESSKTTGSEAMPKVGDVWFIGDGTFGCLNRKDLEQIAKLARQGDRDANAKLLFSVLSMRACRVLKLNSTMYIEEVGPSGFVCGRPQGDTSCLWVHRIGISERMF